MRKVKYSAESALGRGMHESIDDHIANALEVLKFEQLPAEHFLKNGAVDRLVKVADYPLRRVDTKSDWDLLCRDPEIMKMVVQRLVEDATNNFTYHYH